MRYVFLILGTLLLCRCTPSPKTVQKNVVEDLGDYQRLASFIDSTFLQPGQFELLQKDFSDELIMLLEEIDYPKECSSITVYKIAVSGKRSFQLHGYPFTLYFHPSQSELTPKEPSSMIEVIPLAPHWSLFYNHDFIG